MFKWFCGFMTLAYTIKISIKYQKGIAETNDVIFYALYFILMVVSIGFDEIKKLIKQTRR